MEELLLLVDKVDCDEVFPEPRMRTDIGIRIVPSVYSGFLYFSSSCF